MAAALAALNWRFLTPIYVLCHLGSFGFLDARRHHGSSMLAEFTNSSAAEVTENAGLLFNVVWPSWRL